MSSIASCPSRQATLARRAFPHRPYFSFDDDTLRQRAAADPGGFVAGLPDSVTIDEIQRVPTLLSAIKMAVDEAPPRLAHQRCPAPKGHLVDSGVASTLAELVEADWLTNLDRFGHLLESFVVQQLIAQAGWTDSDLRFWHYRGKDQVEVDLVVTRGRDTWGVEVKAGATLSQRDGHGLRRLAEQCGRHFREA